jgi:hypothetical protein
LIGEAAVPKKPHLAGYFDVHSQILGLLKKVKSDKDDNLNLSETTNTIIESILTTGRVAYDDERDGFKKRRARYRLKYELEYGKKVAIGSDDDYRVVDFLAEEWGALVRAKQLKSTELAKADYQLYRALIEHVRALKEGRHGRAPEPDANVTEFLTSYRNSVQERLLPAKDERPNDRPKRRPGLVAAKR